MAVPVNEDALEKSIATSVPFSREQQRERAMADLADGFRKIPFQSGT